ncbi:MAG: hypothetical protein ACNI25_06595 [Halarcobacter sp.]
MQNRYSADIGDFGKFQLLRYLFNKTSYRLTQLWFMYPDETHNSDGMYINYFEKVKGFDEFLENSFRNILNSNRNVKALEDTKLLNNIKYFNDYLLNDACLDFRKKWFAKALEFSKNSDIILTDSDNGIALLCDKKNKDLNLLDSSQVKKRKNSGKYIFIDEIEALYKQSNTLIVYHHLNRCFAHDLQIKCLLEQFKTKYSKVLAIKHKPYSPRVYFILCKDLNNYKYIVESLLVFEKKFSVHWMLFL